MTNFKHSLGHLIGNLLVGSFAHNKWRECYAESDALVFQIIAWLTS